MGASAWRLFSAAAPTNPEPETAIASALTWRAVAKWIASRVRTRSDVNLRATPRIASDTANSEHDANRTSASETYAGSTRRTVRVTSMTAIRLVHEGGRHPSQFNFERRALVFGDDEFDA